HISRARSRQESSREDYSDASEDVLGCPKRIASDAGPFRKCDHQVNLFRCPCPYSSRKLPDQPVCKESDQADNKDVRHQRQHVIEQGDRQEPSLPRAVTPFRQELRPVHSADCSLFVSAGANDQGARLLKVNPRRFPTSLS